MGKLKIVVLYDRVLVDESEETAASDKSPVVRTLDKKEVEEEVAEVVTKLGHEPVMHELDGTQEVNWPAVCRAIVDTGFRGYLAHEFVPTRDPLTVLREAVALCDV